MYYLTASGINRIHEAVIESMGGLGGILDPSLLTSAAIRATTKIQGKEQYVGVIAKATSVGYAVNSWHPFIDGNKRTGLLTIYVIMVINDMDLVVPIYAIKHSVLVAKGKLGEDEFRMIIEKWSSNSWIGGLWRRIRFGWWPMFQIRFLSSLPLALGASKFRERQLDWLAAGDKEMLEQTMKEYRAFRGQGYPKPFKLEFRDGDILEA